MPPLDRDTAIVGAPSVPAGDRRGAPSGGRPGEGPFVYSSGPRPPPARSEDPAIDPAHAPSPLSVVIAAGGTGGHIFPGLAVADAIRRRHPDAEVAFLGTPRGLEGKLVPEAGYPLHLVDMVPFVGSARLLMPVVLTRAALQARRILGRSNADVAIGMGGYASAPLVVGARLARVPSLVHESGAIPGKANVFTARFTPNVALAFPSAAASFRAEPPPRVVGMPLSPELASLDRAALRDEARAALDVPPGVTLLLVSGGSLGAASLDAAAVGLAGRWRDRDDVRILLKPGRDNLEASQRRLADNGGERVCRVVRFIERMDHAYAAADVAVTRGGAGTVAELAVAGLPAVIVPYPHHADDHQAVNAREIVAAGGALLVRDEEATADHLGPMLEALLDEPARLQAMSAAARSVARPRAADEVAAWVDELARPRAVEPSR